MTTYTALVDEARESVLWRIVAAGVRSYRRAWPQSAVAGLGIQLAAAVTSTPWQRLRITAGTVAVALWTGVVAGGLAPEYARTSLPWFWQAAAAVGASVVAIYAPAYVRAWPHSVLARLLRR